MIRPRQTTPIELRRAGPGDGPALREIRLRALADAPAAFAASIEAEAARPPADWSDLAQSSALGQDGAVFAAVTARSERWLGIAGTRWWDDERVVAHLWGMWVDPEVRRQGLGERLVAEVQSWAAAHGARVLRLGVIEGARAEAFYARLGFTPTGETKLLARDGSTRARFLARPV